MHRAELLFCFMEAGCLHLQFTSILWPQSIEPSAGYTRAMRPASKTADEVFPLPTGLYGAEMAIVTVSRSDQAKDFHTHESLSKASDHFSKARHGGFGRSGDFHIHLKENDPVIFNLLDRYLYAGNVHEADSHTKGKVPNDGLWLQTFKLST